METQRSPSQAPASVTAAERTAPASSAAWLSKRILLLVAKAPGDSPMPFLRDPEDWGHALSSRTLHLQPGDDDGDPLELRLVEVPSAFDDWEGKPVDTQLNLPPVVQSDGHLRSALQNLARSYLAGLAAPRRAAVMEFLITALEADGDLAERTQLSHSLHSLREALRSRLPSEVLTSENPRAVKVDALMGIDDRSYYLRGWIRTEAVGVSSLRAVSPEGASIELMPNLFRYRRPDVDRFYGLQADRFESKAGFIAHFELPVPSYMSTGWILEMRDDAGALLETAAPAVLRDRATVRNEVLADVAHEQSAPGDLLSGHIVPAVTRLQEQLATSVRIRAVRDYGRLPASPIASLIVPLYKRIDFVEQQLAHFVHDPDFRDVDLIYVLDSPEQSEELETSAAKLFRLYGLPFRIATLNQNGGYATANNLGASLSNAPKLILLNSDVLPARPGWVSAMASFYSSIPQMGALGAKLLYEDNSLQHAGMYFERLDGEPAWENRHYYKGLHRTYPPANIVRRVPAVTGACLMIDRDLYARVGGLAGVYAQGDYEDSDLCLRLMEHGYENWYLPDAELYHLEGQSYPSDFRRAYTRYNGWLHTSIWREKLEELTAPQDEA